MFKKKLLDSVHPVCLFRAAENFKIFKKLLNSFKNFEKFNEYKYLTLFDFFLYFQALFVLRDKAVISS